MIGLRAGKESKYCMQVREGPSYYYHFGACTYFWLQAKVADLGKESARSEQKKRESFVRHLHCAKSTPMDHLYISAIEDAGRGHQRLSPSVDSGWTTPVLFGPP